MCWCSFILWQSFPFFVNPVCQFTDIQPFFFLTAYSSYPPNLSDYLITVQTSLSIKSYSVQFSRSVMLHSLWPMDCSTSGFPVHHQHPEFTQTQVHRVGDAIQPINPLLPPSPAVLNLSQHQGLFKWVSSSHQVTKVLEFQLQHHSFQWTPRADLL